MIKYGRLLKPGQRIEDVIFDEKVREDELGTSVYRLSVGSGVTCIAAMSFVTG
jgi:hypothetical protein